MWLWWGGSWIRHWTWTWKWSGWRRWLRNLKELDESEAGGACPRWCVAEASEARGRAPRKGWHRGRGGTFHRSSLLRICEGLAPPWGAGARCVAMRCLGCTHHRLALRPQPSSCSSSSCPVPPTPTPPASDSSSSLRFRSQFGREWWDSPEGTRSTWITVNSQHSGSPRGAEGSRPVKGAPAPSVPPFSRCAAPRLRRLRYAPPRAGTA